MNFACGRDIFLQVPSNFCVAGRTFVNFRKLSIRPVDLLSTFYAAGRPSLNIRQFLCSQLTFCEDVSTFGSARKPTVNFFCQVLLQKWNLPRLSLYFPRIWKSFCQLPSAFCATQRPVNFHQVSVRPGEIPSTFLATNRSYVTFWQPSIRPGYLVLTFRAAQGTSVKFRCGQENFPPLSMR